MSWFNPKLDWKETDYHNYADLNRVENNTLEVANYLNGIQYNIPVLTSKTDRDNSFIDFLSSINRIENNIETVKNSFLIPPGYQGSKAWSIGLGFSYLDAIRLENNLSLLYQWSMIAKDNQRFCGIYNCGEEVIFSG